MIRKRLSVSIALGILFAGLALPQGIEAAVQKTSRYVVTFHDGVDALAQSANMSASGLKVVRTYAALFPGVAVDLTADQLGALGTDPNIALIEADSPVTTSQTQSGVIWALDRIDQAESQPNGTFAYPGSAGAGVDVYLVDTGLRNGTSIRNMPHMEFTGRVGAGNSWTQPGVDMEDCNGHGTHVAGSIAGATYGVAKMANLIPLQVLDCAGRGRMSDVVAALDWVAANRNPARPAVVNMSLSGPASQTMDNAVTRLFDSGVTVVVAAGNDGGYACNFSPARVPVAITVGASSTVGHRAAFSNMGPCLDIWAPGTKIESTWISSVTSVYTSAGTSSSAAFVSGVAALILGENPSLTSHQVRERILTTATPDGVQNAGDGSPTLLLRVPSAG